MPNNRSNIMSYYLFEHTSNTILDTIDKANDTPHNELVSDEHFRTVVENAKRLTVLFDDFLDEEAEGDDDE